MPRVTRETHVPAPPERVFQALVDPAERARWIASMREDPHEGALAVGTRITARRTSPASRSTYELRVTRLEPHRLLETHVKRNGADVGLAGYELHAADGGTHVRGYGEFELHGLQRMMTPVVASGMERELEQDLAALRRHLGG